MSEFRIEKLRRRVAIDLVGGARLDGDVFLQQSARYRSGPQSPAELFNEPDPFVPIATSDADFVLVAKAQVLRVQFAPDAADTDDREVEGVAVEIVLADGSFANGELRLEMRAERPRLLDFLNADDRESFLTLRSAADVLLINRRQIAQVRQRR